VIARVEGVGQSGVYDSVTGPLKSPNGPTEGRPGEILQHIADPEPEIVEIQSFLIPTIVETVVSGPTRWTFEDEDTVGLTGACAPVLQAARIANAASIATTRPDW
jgi:hypothetical protein